MSVNRFTDGALQRIAGTGAPAKIEVMTQAEYDALVASGEVDPDTTYLIGDGSIDKDGNVIASASNVGYDNSTSGLAATNTQNAIDELASNDGYMKSGDKLYVAATVGAFSGITWGANKIRVFIPVSDKFKNISDITVSTGATLSLWTISGAKTFVVSSIDSIVLCSKNTPLGELQITIIGESDHGVTLSTPLIWRVESDNIVITCS